MRKSVRITKYIVVLITVIFFSACRALFYNIPDLSDYEIFPYRKIGHDINNKFTFIKTTSSRSYGEKIFVKDKPLGSKLVNLNEYCELTKTAAYLIIRNDSLLYEYYGKGEGESKINNSFSMTKAFLTTLTGIAIDESKINSVNDPVSLYISEYRDSDIGRVKIRQLLKHTSGIKYHDNHKSPFSDNAKYYYGKNLRKYVLNLKLKQEPGTEFNYNSANSQLLALVLERATGTTLSSYLEQKLWTKIGMEYDATWSIDRKGASGMEKGFTGINATAIDLAKLGRLYLNKGVFNKDTILSETFIREATKRDISEGSLWDYEYNFGVGPEKYHSFYAVGFYGQLIYVYPEKNIIIVRLVEADKHYNPAFVYYTTNQILDQL
jgi:CubicO group peptidase (beta-lactamase class C family)